MKDSDYTFKSTLTNHGLEEGDKCNRNGCEGVLLLPKTENCSCHISPPCSACVDNCVVCPVCDWKYSNEYIKEKFNGFVIDTNKKTNVHEAWKLRELDNSKIDFHSLSHTNSSMIKRGVYPEGATKEQVLAKVIGTFGGRFNYFRDGKFEYVSYTD